MNVANATALKAVEIRILITVNISLFQNLISLQQKVLL